ncbi:MAG: SDR family NAD(P)-dependent oxidoreductase [Caldilineaceae bacterium]
MTEPTSLESPVGDRPVALVTGSRTGIGRHLAEHLLRAGYLVEGCSRSAAAWGDDWEPTRYVHHLLDVGDEAQVKAMMSDIQRRRGRLDVAINNAGIASMNHALLTPATTMEGLLRTNLLGTALVCREAAKLMRRRHFGRIINMGTIAVPLELEGEAIYAATKSAVVTYTRIFAREVAEFGITCNVIGPTPVETDLVRSVPREKLQAILDRLAIHRFGTMDDVANVVDFFLRPESSAITGQVIYLGGA